MALIPDRIEKVIVINRNLGNETVYGLSENGNFYILNEKDDSKWDLKAKCPMIQVEENAPESDTETEDGSYAAGGERNTFPVI